MKNYFSKKIQKFFYKNLKIEYESLTRYPFETIQDFKWNKSLSINNLIYNSKNVNGSIVRAIGSANVRLNAPSDQNLLRPKLFQLITPIKTARMIVACATVFCVCMTTNRLSTLYLTASRTFSALCMVYGQKLATCVEFEWLSL